MLHEAGRLHRTHSGMSPSVAASLSTLLQEAVSQVVPVSGVVEGVGIAVGVAVGVAVGGFILSCCCLFPFALILVTDCQQPVAF